MASASPDPLDAELAALEAEIQKATDEAESQSIGLPLIIWFVTYAFCGINIDPRWKLIGLDLAPSTYYAILTTVGAVLGAIAGFQMEREEAKSTGSSRALWAVMAGVWGAACSFGALWVVQQIYDEVAERGWVNDAGVLIGGVLAVAVANVVLALLIILLVLPVAGTGWFVAKLFPKEAQSEQSPEQ